MGWVMWAVCSIWYLRVIPGDVINLPWAEWLHDKCPTPGNCGGPSRCDEAVATANLVFLPLSVEVEVRTAAKTRPQRNSHQGHIEQAVWFGQRTCLSQRKGRGHGHLFDMLSHKHETKKKKKLFNFARNIYRSRFYLSLLGADRCKYVFLSVFHSDNFSVLSISASFCIEWNVL